MHRFPLALAAFLFPTLLTAQIRLAPEQRVNSGTTGDQRRPAVAAHQNGAFVVAWEGPDGDGSGVFFRSFDALGVPLSTELRATDSAAGEQFRPALASDRLGGFVIAWEESDPPLFGAGNTVVRFRRFSRSGVALGSETTAGGAFPPTGGTTTEQRHPAVARAANGRFVLAFDERSTAAAPAETGIVVVAFEADGALRGTCRLAAPAADHNVEPDVALLPDGTSRVVFAAHQDDESDAGVFLASVPAGSFANCGAPLAVNDLPAGFEAHPALVTDGLGQLVVTWSADEAPGSPFRHVRARRFDSSGAALGAGFRAHDSMDSDNRDPDVAGDPDGRFTLAWERQAGAARSLFFRGYASSAQPLDTTERPPGSAGAVEREDVAVAMDANGDFVLAWQAEGAGQDGDGSGVYAERYTTRCEPSETNLCLGERFKVEAAWRTANGERGLGRGVALTPDTGTFWFFDPDNVELIVKVLDACLLNQRYWVFASGLTDVEVELLVTDTRGQIAPRKLYLNSLGTAFAPIQDTGAFGTCGVPTLPESSAVLAEAEPGAPRPPPRELLPEGGTCVATPTRLCLGGRFGVEVTWLTPTGAQGPGMAVPVTTDTGYFWFFDRANVEMILKVLDACPLNGRFWVFAAGLTNVRVEVTVTDTHNGAQRSYLNPANSPFQPIQDTSAFATCP